ncbi:hypothetical protein J6590_014016 [Homalodisca vitripennis]|nr:hypothetical protein J6590_014016 [Homalodisca vitripennis]
MPDLTWPTPRSNSWTLRWDILNHPPHSPDLVHSDFHLFTSLKVHMSGNKFSTDKEMKGEVEEWAKELARENNCKVQDYKRILSLSQFESRVLQYALYTGNSGLTIKRSSLHTPLDKNSSAATATGS